MVGGSRHFSNCKYRVMLTCIQELGSPRHLVLPSYQDLQHQQVQASDSCQAENAGGEGLVHHANHEAIGDFA